MNFAPGGDDPAATITAELQQLADERAPILQQLSEGVIIAGIDGRLVFVNEAAERLHGVKQLDVAPDEYSETYSLFTMEREPYPFEELPLARAVARGETVEDARWLIRRPDGSEVIAIGSARPLMTDGRQIGAILNVRDDSERFEAEHRLSESEERLRLVIDAAPGAFYSVDRDGNTILVSRGFLDLIGFKDESEALGRKLHDVIHHTHPDGSHYPTEECPIYRCASAGTPTHIPDEKFFRLDGSPVPVEYWVSPIIRGGEHIGAICTILDLTERKAAQTAVRESEARFRNMADDAPVMMWVTEPDGYCSYLNRGWYDFTGQTEDEALGFGWLKAVHPDDSAEAERAFVEANANSAPFRVEYRLRRADGVYRWAIDAASPRFGDQGQWLGFIGSVIDIDERKRFEETLEARNRRLDLLARIASGLNRETSATERLKTVFVDLAREVEADYYFNFLVDESDPTRLRLDSAGGLSDDQREAFAEIGVGEYLCGRIAETRQAVIIDDLDKSDDPSCGSVINLDGKSYAGFPLIADNRLIGTISFASIVSSRFTTEQVSLMQTVADQVAASLDRDRVTDALRSRSEEFHALADNIPTLAWMAYANGEIFWYNRRWYEFTGTTPESQEGWGWESVHDPAVLPAVVERWAASLESGTEFEMTFPLRGADGIFRPFLTRAVPIRDENGELVRWFGTNTDVTAQLELETRQRLALSLSDRLRELSNPREIVAAAVEVLGRHLGVSRVGFGELSADNQMVTFETDYVDGVEHLIGTFPIANFGRDNMADLARGETTIYPDLTADPRTNDADWSVIQTRAAMAVPLIRDGRMSALLYLNHTEVREWSADEVTLVQDVAARVWDALERARAEAALHQVNATLEARVEQEIARRTDAEETLRQAQKMEAIGQLTGGIAHDFNNLLQIIAGNLDILRRNLTEDSPRLRRSIDNALKGAERAAVLTQRLLAFSRRQPLEPKVIDPNKLVSGMSDMLHRTLGETYAIETVTAPGLWRVEADPNQLEGALLNLAINARDAMPDGGKLTIETANTHIDRDYADRHSGVSPGQYVVTCVSDTGSGMDAETAERAVEPFFTTKEVGKGTGLGLSMVYGFVKQSGGHLKIYSEPGQGTTVKIYLPRHQGEESDEALPAPERAREGTDNETILLCEDDDDVRAFSAETLRELGYRVIEACDGEAALELLAPERGRIDLLFTDVVLPGITGAVLAERARALRPGLKVLFTTGYARNAIVHHGRLDAGVELLSKPFTFAELSARIRDLLDEA